jgi:DNA-binding HxlR family transcriptional regulator
MWLHDDGPGVRIPVQDLDLQRLAPRPRLARMARSYGQFCPIAQAAQVICERWTPLVLRELMNGSRRFNELAAGVPRMSRSLLAQRLRELQDAGVVVSTQSGNGRGNQYLLTPAGEAIRPIIESLGMWSQHWGRDDIPAGDIDDRYLPWGLRRILRSTLLGRRRLVLRLDFRGLKGSRVAQRSWWLLVGADDVDVCLKDPGFDVDAAIAADLRTYVRVMLGREPLTGALRAGSIRFDGPREIVRALPGWLHLDGRARESMGIA